MAQFYETVTIPTTSNPYRVIVNGVEYKYEAGATVEVPPEVAAAINASVNAASDLVKPGEVSPPFGASGDSGGGSDIFFITATTDYETREITIDKTYDEALEAYISGKYLVLAERVKFGEQIAPLYYSASVSGGEGLRFAHVDSNGGIWETSFNVDNTLTNYNFVNINHAAVKNRSGIIMQSSTGGSDKLFRIKVFDDGSITATEVT